MRSDKNARHDAATSERAEEQRKPVEDFSVSEQNYTYSGVRSQSLLEYIPRDPEKAVTAARLGELLQMSPRDVTRTIQRYRLAGVPICAACGEPHGYFIAESPEVLGRYLRSLDGRVSEVRRTREALSATLDKLTGQERMEGF